MAECRTKARASRPTATLRGFLGLLWDMAWETFATTLVALTAVVGASTVFCLTPEFIRLVYFLRGQRLVCVCRTGDVIQIMGTTMAADALDDIIGGVYFLTWFAGFFSVAWYVVDRWQRARVTREQTWS
jgi:hypothetical protein